MDFHAGDLLLFYGKDWTSRSISCLTRGPSHVAIISRTSDQGPLLVESTTLCDLPDAVTGSPTAGVQLHDPGTRVQSYNGGVKLLRLAPVWELDRNECELLSRVLSQFRGAQYDLPGALVSGTRWLKWASCMPYADLRALFCSELCAVALMRLGRLPPANPALFNPASLVRALRRAGIYQAPVVLDADNLSRC